MWEIDMGVQHTLCARPPWDTTGSKCTRSWAISQMQLVPSAAAVINILSLVEGTNCALWIENFCFQPRYLKNVAFVRCLKRIQATEIRVVPKFDLGTFRAIGLQKATFKSSLPVNSSVPVSLKETVLTQPPWPISFWVMWNVLNSPELNCTCLRQRWEKLCLRFCQTCDYMNFQGQSYPNMLKSRNLWMVDRRWEVARGLKQISTTTINQQVQTSLSASSSWNWILDEEDASFLGEPSMIARTR